jgi:hypothetical protein
VKPVHSDLACTKALRHVEVGLLIPQQTELERELGPAFRARVRCRYHHPIALHVTHQPLDGADLRLGKSVILTGEKEEIDAFLAASSAS